FASINYNALLPVFNSNVTPPAYSDLKEKKYTVFVVTGIGNPKPVFDFCRNTAENVNIISFKDHHGYTEKDIYDICKKFNNSDSENKIIITTEKDAVKLRALNISDKICKDNFFYCPVNIKILNNEKEELDNLILRFTEKSSSQYRFLTSKKKY
ncbi:MAG: hypothetical protein GXO50_04160, partial [Chlorobi bacterium]|nr:hypothetical protein [Chlorobiota bacterium]